LLRGLGRSRGNSSMTARAQRLQVVIVCAARFAHIVSELAGCAPPAGSAGASPEALDVHAACCRCRCVHHVMPPRFCFLLWVGSLVLGCSRPVVGLSMNLNRKNY